VGGDGRRAAALDASRIAFSWTHRVASSPLDASRLASRGRISRRQHSANADHADDAETAGSALLAWTLLVSAHGLNGSVGRLFSPDRLQPPAAVILWGCGGEIPAPRPQAVAVAVAVSDSTPRASTRSAHLRFGPPSEASTPVEGILPFPSKIRVIRAPAVPTARDASPEQRAAMRPRTTLGRKGIGQECASQWRTIQWLLCQCRQILRYLQKYSQAVEFFE
jgi:hypothetical protein